MKKIIHLVLVLAVVGMLGAVVHNGALDILGSLTVAGTRTALSRGTSDPSSCIVGDVFTRTDLAAASQFRVCTTTGTPGTWTAQGGGGSSNVIIDKPLASYSFVGALGASVCQSTVVTDTTTSCALLPAGGSPEAIGALNLPEATAREFTVSGVIPTGYTANSAVTVAVYSASDSPASGDMHVEAKVSCIRPGTTSMFSVLTFNTASTLNATVLTSLGLVTTFSGVVANTCQVDDIMTVNISRLPANGGDTSVRDWFAAHVKVTY